MRFPRLALPLLLALSAISAGAADAPDRSIPPLVESVTVDIVNIDVVVTDKKGNRVRGLGRDDFQLIQDGRPQTITHFYSVEGGRAILASATAPAAEGAPEPAAVPEKRPPTWIVIYVDNMFLAPFNRNRAIRDVTEFLRRNLASETQAMVITADRSFKIRQNFTPKLSALVGILEKVQNENSYGSQRAADRSQLFQEIEESEDWSRVDSRVRNYAQEVRNDVDFSLGSLKDAIQTFAGLEGRKILLHVSDGLPAVAGKELFEAIGRKFRMASYSANQTAYDRNMSFDAVINLANSVGISIYTLDATGLSLEGSGNAEQGRPSAMGESLTATRWNTQDPLKALAEGTGGVAILNRNTYLESLAQVAEDFTNYYSLGFPAPSAGSSRIRRIEVKMKKPGLQARVRRGFSEKTIHQRIGEAVTSRLYFPQDTNPLGLQVARGKPREASEGLYHVPIQMKIPLGKITTVPQADQEVGRVEFFFIVLDTNGDRSELQTVHREITLPTAEAAAAKREGNFIFDTTLLMQPGSQRISIAARDEISNDVSYVSRDIFVSVFDTDRSRSGDSLPPRPDPSQP